MTKRYKYRVSSVAIIMVITALSIRLAQSWQIQCRVVGRSTTVRSAALALRSRTVGSSQTLARGMASAPLEEGDSVQVVLDGDVVSGVVREKRGSGWYAVGVPSTDGEDIVKVRGSQLSPATAAHDDNSTVLSKLPSVQPVRVTNEVTEFRVQTTTTATPTMIPPPPPTIFDLDSALEESGDPVENKRDRMYLQQCAHHASFDKWVLFTDLHCAPSSLDTCLEVLETVHQAAVERNAGVLFLGDFWHHRAVIRINVLNAVLEALRSWQVPMVMIPGNHDQVTLGGHNHGLTPLENSYQVDLPDGGTVPGPLVFSHPTKFRNALFVPHIRDNTVMESVLRSRTALESSALLVHADVTGAYMNDLIVSLGGVSPSCFPPDRPIYSGHFHKPHLIKSGKVSIEYVGSPYETSLAEAQQPKALWVLDAKKNWKCTEKIPLQIGRKHFRPLSVDDFSRLHVFEARDTSREDCSDCVAMDIDGFLVRAGDRVVVSVAKDELEEARQSAKEGHLSDFDAKVKSFRQAGALVEVREVKSVVLEAMGTGGAEHASALEEMSPQTALAAYLSEELRREAMITSTAEAILKAGLALIDELEESEESFDGVASSANDTDFVVDSVSIEGFGPFKDMTTYPLRDRGLVLIRGSNKDGGSDSNGSGKSSLAMATLWALTGTVDPRPAQDSKVSDVVNDSSKVARVAIRGELNKVPFVISRTKTSSKGSLSFQYGGQDLTMQSMKDTQVAIDEKLGSGPEVLARSMFHGQHSINGLLEATDAKLKEELSLLVPLALWQNGASVARKRSREASKKASEVTGMVSLRTNDLEDLVRRRDSAREASEAKVAALQEQERRLQEELDELQKSRDRPESSIDNPDLIEEKLQVATRTVEVTEHLLISISRERDEAIGKIRSSFEKASHRLAVAEENLQSAQRSVDQQAMNQEMILESKRLLEQKWAIDLSSGDAVTVPMVCPTCNQPVAGHGDGHSHAQLQSAMNEEVSAVTKRLSAFEDSHRNSTCKYETAIDEADDLKRQVESASLEMSNAQSDWSRRLQTEEKLLQEARHRQVRLATELSGVSKQVRLESAIEGRMSAVEAVRDSVALTRTAYDGLCHDVAEAEQSLREMELTGGALQGDSKIMAELADVFSQRGVQTFVLQNAVEALQRTCQSYLDELSDGNQLLELSLDSGDRISRRAFVRGADGNLVERPLSSLSGGQWRRCSLSMSLGFADLVARRGKLRPSVIVLDEPLTHLDRTGRSRVGALLRKLLRDHQSISDLGNSGLSATTILLILQDLAAEELEESFDRIDEVVKENGLSSVIIDEMTG